MATKLQKLSPSELPDGIEYHPRFIRDERKMFTALLEEFFYLEPKYVMYGGQRMTAGSFRSDAHNSFTKPKGTDGVPRDVLKKSKWQPTTALIAGLIEGKLGVSSTVTTFNFYQDGSDFIAPHSDVDHMIGPTSSDVVVATVSLGSSRDVEMTRIGSDEGFRITLEPGSLFVMRGLAQRQWRHSIPEVDDAPPGSRLSATFVHHQTSPASMLCWVLVKLGTHSLLESVDPFDGNAVPGEQELVSSMDEVFTAWCSRKDWHDCQVLGPERVIYTTPMEMLMSNPELVEKSPSHVLDSAPLAAYDDEQVHARNLMEGTIHAASKFSANESDDRCRFGAEGKSCGAATTAVFVISDDGGAYTLAVCPDHAQVLSVTALLMRMEAKASGSTR